MGGVMIQSFHHQMICLSLFSQWQVKGWQHEVWALAAAQHLHQLSALSSLTVAHLGVVPMMFSPWCSLFFFGHLTTVPWGAQTPRCQVSVNRSSRLFQRKTALVSRRKLRV